MKALLSALQRINHTLSQAQRIMALGCWAAGGLLLGACAGHSRHTHAGEVGPITNIQPPWFLITPVNVLLTNTPGYGGHLVAFDTRAAAESSRPLEGELLCRGELLLFVPDEKKHKHGSGPELGYIWDVNQHKGYVFSETLQGYAPLVDVPGSEKAASVRSSKTDVTERLDGHACHVEDMSITTDRGGTAEYRVSRAPDLHGLPLEIRALASTNSVTLRFSEMRLDVPALELFQPPPGFTGYPTVDALSNELLARSQGAPRRRSGDTQNLGDDSDTKHGRHGGTGH